MNRILAVLSLLALSLSAVNLPRPAGELVIHMPDGKVQLLSHYKGKVVVLAMILTTCPHCQATTGVLNTIQADYAKRGLQVLEAAINPDAPQKIAEFITKFKPAYPAGTIENSVVVNYGQFTPDMRPTVPILFFIDRQGQIRNQFMGSDLEGGDPNLKIRAEIDKLINAKAAASPAKK